MVRFYYYLLASTELGMLALTMSAPLFKNIAVQSIILKKGYSYQIYTILALVFKDYLLFRMLALRHNSLYTAFIFKLIKLFDKTF